MATEPDVQLLRAVGRRIAELRRGTGMTQEQVAERLGVSVRAYAYLEGGRENLTLLTMASVATALGVGVAELLVPPASTVTRRGRPPRRAG